MSAPSEMAPASGASMIEQHQRHALSAIAVGLVMLLTGCANVNAAAAQPTSSAAATVAASSTRTAPASTTPSLGDNQSGCAARAMARGKFDPECGEYQGYLDPGTADGRAPTSGEIQQQTLCRSGEISKNEC